MQATKGSTMNAKRVLAENSVCIRKSPPKAASSNLSVVSNLAAIGEETGRWSRNGNTQQAESAKSWFDDSNKNVSSEHGQRFYTDEDPPYFLRHKSSSDESMSIPPRHTALARPGEGRDMRQTAALLSRIQTVESSSEDFRSVIDDLTIENRKLKKRLRKYERINCGQLQSDKLFELRVHGLPAAKKRKLERTLQEFALSLGDAPEEDQQPSAFARNLAKVATKKPFSHHNTSSSGTSNSRTFADSAYASMSNNSSHAHISRGDSGHASMAAKANDQAVRSYLQSLSRGLLPKSLPVLTETTKKEVVVQRLEQLFVGSRDHSSKDSQSKQQQEVSQSAATADRKTNEAEGKRATIEGRRESKILAVEEEPKNNNKLPMWNRTDTESSEDTISSSATPDQRPTRPLDLDPSRAQVPEDNIGYMKHLGFGSPPMNPAKTVDEDEGWIYLNLLTGMAQLHILNVTPEFVRSAIRDVSTHFELSSDGSRIRWKGGKGVTKLISDSGELSTHSSNYSYDAGIMPTENSRGSKSIENQSGTGSGNNQSSNAQSNCYPAVEKHRPMLLSQTNPVNSQQYRPLFYHDNNHSDESGTQSYDDKDSSLSSGPIESTTQNASGPGHGMNKRALHSKVSRPIDPIIFYNRAKFYTDLSKDDEGMSYNCPIYTKVVKTAVGIKENSNSTSLGLEDKGPISKSSDLMVEPEAEHANDSSPLAGFNDTLQSISTAEGKGRMPVRFEASGIGGVVPGDHFRIDVDMRVGRASTSTKVSNKILSSKTTEMLPSMLPPPSYAFLPFSSSSEDNSDDSESEEDVNMDDEDAYEQDIKAYIPLKFLNSFSSEGSQEEQDDDDDMSDDSSIDMLAHAREAAPEKVAAAEREFEKYNSIREEDQTMDVAPTASSVVATLGDQSFEKEDRQDKHRSKAATVLAAKAFL